MKKATFMPLALLASLVFTVLATTTWAQEAVPASAPRAVPPPAPATKQDLQELRKELLRAKQAAERAAKIEDAHRSAEKQELNGIKTAVSDSSEAQKSDAAKVAGEIANQKALIAAEAAKNRRTTVWFVSLSSVGLLLIGGTVFAWWVRKGRNAKTEVLPYWERPGERRRLMEPEKSIFVATIPRDSIPEEIKKCCAKYAEQTGKTSFDLPYQATLKETNEMASGTVHAEKNSDGKWIYGVDFPGVKRARLKNRYEAAAQSTYLSASTAHRENREFLQ